MPPDGQLPEAVQAPDALEAPGGLVLYGAPHCQPCQVAKAALAALAQGRALAWRYVDLTEDPAARKRFGQRIPVLMQGDRLLGEGRLDAAALRAILLREGLLGSSLR